MKPAVEFKRVTLNQIITFSTRKKDHAAEYKAQFFNDAGTLLLEKELSLDEVVKLKYGKEFDK